MPSVVNHNLAGFTVDYNGVQFGGADALHSSLPPTYNLRATPQWDESNRTIMWVECTLQVNCIFFEDTLSDMGANMRDIRAKLMTPGKLLRLSGLGSGFDYIRLGASHIGNAPDIANGPRTLDLQMNSFGQLCWELIWVCKFSVMPCIGQGGSLEALAFASFNFNTTWRNDFEGRTTRIIQGTLSIPQYRDSVTPKTVVAIAEQTRGNIIVDTPPNFKRVDNTWHETEDKQHLAFTIVDEQLEGAAYPPGIVAADGSFAFVSGGEQNPTMSRSICTLQMSLKVAYNQPPNYAGQVFLAAVLSKQTELAGIGGDGQATITVVPLHLSIVNGKFDNARTTQCAMSWVVTKSLNDCLTAAKIWEPVSALLTGPLGGAQDYTQWRASMASLWGNRGFSGITGLASEAVIIDLCDNITTKTIGVAGSSPNTLVDSALSSLTCPSVPVNGGWVHFDLDIRVHRKDSKSEHKAAAAYLPTLGEVTVVEPGSGGSAVKLGGHNYSQSASHQTVTEYHGYPEYEIALSFAGLRFVNKAFMPEIKTVQGFPVRLKSQEGGTPKWHLDAFGCPVWSVTGYRIYTVPGYVSEVKPISSAIATDTSIPYDL